MGISHRTYVLHVLYMYCMPRLAPIALVTFHIHVTLTGNYSYEEYVIGELPLARSGTTSRVQRGCQSYESEVSTVF